MIPLGGLSTGLAVKLVESTRSQQIDLIAREARNARQIEAFQDRIATITSPKDLIADTEVYTFVMRAFDLEDQIFGKAMIRKMLESDRSDTGALVNRLTDSRFRDMHRTFDFVPGGGPSDAVQSAAWRDAMVERFTDRQLINNAEADSRGAGLALDFKARAAGIESWFDVLKNRGTAEFMRTALGLPDEMVQLDIDRQAEMFAAKIDIAALKDPAEVDRLVSRFAAIHDARNAPSLTRNAAVALMQGALSVGSGAFTPVTIDIEAVQAMGSVSRYR